MPDLIITNCNNSISIIASEQQQPALPGWFSEIIVIAHLWAQSGMVAALQQQVKVTRGRMGDYEVVDFTLLLLAYALSQELTLNKFYQQLLPVRAALLALWERNKTPSASALSRFLSAITDQAVTQLRKLLFQDLLNNGIGLEQLGGLYDRTGARHIIFDIDATKDAARQRSLPSSPDYPPARRRRSNYGPGYAGRKRGEVIRSRSTVQQAHTSEWLGTFGAAGNGDIWAELEQGCKLINSYMQAHALNPSQALVRLDGAYGWARGVFVCQQSGVGYLIRCCDYKLLDSAEFKQQLAVTAPEQFYQVDTSATRQLYDLGFINWQGGKDKSMAVRSRFIVACSNVPADKSKLKVGKLQGNIVYELFITDRALDQLTASDIVSLYYGRGGFEQTLSQEDQEQDPDRFCSQNPFGQQFWQLLAQSVWNVRLRLAFASQTPKCRRTIWAQAINSSENSRHADNSNNEMLPIEKVSHNTQATAQGAISTLPNNNKAITSTTPYCTNSSAPLPEEIASGKIKMARPTKEAIDKFSGEKFLLQSDGTLKCPANKILKPGERRTEAHQFRIVYQASANDCRNCPLAIACRIDINAGKGRRVSILLPLSITEQTTAQLPPTTDKQNLLTISRVSIESCSPNLALGTEPVYWLDLPASSLRRFLPDLLRAQQIEITLAVLPISTNVVAITRDQRAHRRLSWPRRMKRNAAPRYSSPWRFHIYGLPQKLSAYLSSISSLAA
jgi:hypothetical protein